MYNRLVTVAIFLFLTVSLSFAYFHDYEKYKLEYTQSYGVVSTTKSYNEITKVFTGDWQKYGQKFTILQKKYFRIIYFWLVIGIPAIFLLHYLVIGPKKFSHEGEKILVFNLFNRFVHWITAASFTILITSGLVIIFGKYFGGGSFVRTMRYIHAPAALVFVPFAILMFLMWVKDMIIAPGDITWFIKFGGYLSKKTENIMPVGKFNPGQKSWFWLATLGGMVMGFTGYYIFSFDTHVDNLRLYAMIHNILGMAMVAMFFVHLYMAIFAIKGSLKSMITGYKHEDEIRVLHCKYYKKITGKECSK